MVELAVGLPCEACRGWGWVCEDHPYAPFSTDPIVPGCPCDAPGMPCPHPPPRRGSARPGVTRCAGCGLAVAAEYVTRTGRTRHGTCTDR